MNTNTSNKRHFQLQSVGLEETPALYSKSKKSKTADSSSARLEERPAGAYASKTKVTPSSSEPQKTFSPNIPSNKKQTKEEFVEPQPLSNDFEELLLTPPEPTILKPAAVSTVTNDNVMKLDELVQQIVNGQVDDTKDPDISEEEAVSLANALYAQANAIIAENAAKQKSRQKRLGEAISMEMQQMEAEQITRENLELIQSINKALTSSYGRLNRTQRLALNTSLHSLINNTVTSFESHEQLEYDTNQLRENVKGLFNALIQYYTEMASYGYNNSSSVLSKIGSILAGCSMLSGVITTQQTYSQGGLLISLSRYLGTTTMVASGLYCLSAGGVPIKDILETIGRNTRECITSRFSSGCNLVTGEIQKISETTLTAITYAIAGDYSNFTIDFDDSTGNISIVQDTSVASEKSNQSSASEASKQVSAILNVPQEQQVEQLIQTISTNIPTSVDIQADNLVIQDDLGMYDDLNMSQITDETDSQPNLGGKKRKSRRHKKRIIKTRKRKQCRKRRFTHKLNKCSKRTKRL